MRGRWPAKRCKAGAYCSMLPDRTQPTYCALGKRRGKMAAQSSCEHSRSIWLARSGLGLSLFSTAALISGSVMRLFNVPVLMSSAISRHCFCSVRVAPTMVAAIILMIFKEGKLQHTCSTEKPQRVKSPALLQLYLL